MAPAVLNERLRCTIAGRKNRRSRPPQQNRSAEKCSDSRHHREDHRSWFLGYARAFRVGRMGVYLSSCGRYYCSRLWQLAWTLPSKLVNGCIATMTPVSTRSKSTARSNERISRSSQLKLNHISFVVQMMAPGIGGTRGDPLQERTRSLRNFDPDSEQSRKALQFLKDHHTFIDPTLPVYELAMRASPVVTFEPGVAKVAPALSVQLRRGSTDAASAEFGEARFAVLVKAVAALHRAGVPVVVGTDQAVPGHSVHRSMELFVDAGFTPMEALQAATIVSARAMGIDKETGTIEAGKQADLVILGGNPLDNISNVRKTEQVMQVGVLFDCAALWKSAGFLP